MLVGPGPLGSRGVLMAFNDEQPAGAFAQKHTAETGEKTCVAKRTIRPLFGYAHQVTCIEAERLEAPQNG